MTPLEQRRAAAVRARAVSHARTRARTDARIEDLAELIDAGTPIETACARVGWSVKAAHSALARRQHPMTRPLSRLVSQQRRSSHA